MVQARNLQKKDISVSGDNPSDPYAIINVGDQGFKTAVASETDNPKWDFWCEVPVFSRV